MTADSHSLASYASQAAASRGRLYPEPESETRTPFQRDRDRIIHCSAFRRLQYKTQVFVYHEGDHYRTRLTHSLEVAQIARSLSRMLGLDSDLAEALSLAHDLGHTPFGHAGEDALQAAMADFGGFDHNSQTLRILTRLERRYADFDGLNLTFETLEGTLKHNGPLASETGGLNHLPEPILAYLGIHDLEPTRWPGLEAQVAALSDDIAYTNHDIDDGLRADLFAVDDLLALPRVGPIFQEIADRHPGLDRVRTIHEAVRRLIGAMIHDVAAETRRRLETAEIETAEDVRAHDGALVGFSESMRMDAAAVKAFLFARMYRHPLVNRSTSKARRVVRDLFGLFIAEPNTLPEEWQAQTTGPHTARTARVVCDYIAGMTDRYAIIEHKRLFDLGTEL